MFDADLCTIAEERWKLGNAARRGAKEHRLEAYATLFFRTAERSLKPSPRAIAVHAE
jgi:hypothetical protein